MSKNEISLEKSEEAHRSLYHHKSTKTEGRENTS